MGLIEYSDDRWKHLRRLQLGVVLCFAGALIYWGLLGLYGLGTLERIMTRYRLSNDWMPAFVLPALIPEAVFAWLLWRFDCPACGRRFISVGGFLGVLRRSCARCGAKSQASALPLPR
jgi:hypothetical protein